jgi:hypothetical protein
MTAKRDIFRQDGQARRKGPVPGDRSAPPASALAAAFQRAVSPALRADDVLALQRAVGNGATAQLIARHPGSGTPLTTATIQRKVEAGKLNIVGEYHDESDDRRQAEKEMLKSFGPYWGENEFTYKVGDQTRHGDSLEQLVIHSLIILSSAFESLESWTKSAVEALADNVSTVQEIVDNDVKTIKKRIDKALEETEQLKLALRELSRSQLPDAKLIEGAQNLWRSFFKGLIDYSVDIPAAELKQRPIENAKRKGIKGPEQEQQPVPRTLQTLLTRAGAWRQDLAGLLATHGYDLNAFTPSPDKKKSAHAQMEKQIVGERSLHMWMSAVEAAEQAHVTGVWKVGTEHVDDLKGQTHGGVTLTTSEAFTKDYEAWEATNKAGATGAGGTSQATTGQQ